MEKFFRGPNLRDTIYDNHGTPPLLFNGWRGDPRSYLCIILGHTHAHVWLKVRLIMHIAWRVCGTARVSRP